jgi:hypothetical protein
MRLGRGNQNTQRKPSPEPICPPRIPHNMIWEWIWDVRVGSWWPKIWYSPMINTVALKITQHGDNLRNNSWYSKLHQKTIFIIQRAETTMHLEYKIRNVWYVCTLNKYQPFYCIHTRGHCITSTIPVQNIIKDYKLDYQNTALLQAELDEGNRSVNTMFIDTFTNYPF